MYEQYAKLGEYIVTNTSYRPEEVGDVLAEATADIDTWLKDVERQAALRKRQDARDWLKLRAAEAGHPLWSGAVVKGKDIDFTIILEGVIQGSPAQFRIEPVNSREETSAQLWTKMGSKPFYRVKIYDAYLNKSIEGYIGKDKLEQKLKMVEQS